MTAVEVGGRRVELQHDVTFVTVDRGARDDVVAAIAGLIGPPPAAPAPPPPPAASNSGGTADEAEAAVAERRAALEQAEREAASAEQAQAAAAAAADATDQVAAGGADGADGADAVAAAEARLEVARAGAAAARRALDEARGVAVAAAADLDAQRHSASEAVQRLEAERAELLERRGAVLERIAEVGDVPDAASVEEALTALRRLREVKPRPSSRAGELADQWAAVRERLAGMPAPPSPPEWLVAPALAALQDAREALAEAERVGRPDTVDAATVEAVELAHRQVLDAEQRVMEKASRGNRRRLDQALAAEREALTRFGVGSYGEYLQAVAPGADGSGSAEGRVARARAALADAEAVWEELHGGQASPAYTAAKQEEAAVRAEAHALLGEEVPDEGLEEALRGHLETVVDTSWAERALADALASAGARVAGDVEPWAEAWLATVPEQRARRGELDAEVASIDERVAAVEDELAQQRAAAFFGDEAPAGEEGAGEPAAGGEDVAEQRAALEEADAAEREAAAALEQARERAAAAARAGELASAAAAARDAVGAARAALAAAEGALAEARAAAATATQAPAGTSAGGLDPIETDLWLLARLVSAAAAAGDAPLVVDARAAGSSARGRGLVERAAARRPVVVVGDEEEVTAWAADLGDRAAVRSV